MLCKYATLFLLTIFFKSLSSAAPDDLERHPSPPLEDAMEFPPPPYTSVTHPTLPAAHAVRPTNYQEDMHHFAHTISGGNDIDPIYFATIRQKYENIPLDNEIKCRLNNMTSGCSYTAQEILNEILSRKKLLPVAAIKGLIELHGANIHTKEWETPLLIIAIDNGYLDAVPLLIAAGARVNQALFYAVAHKNFEALQTLINHHANVNIKDQNRNTLLHAAFSTGCAENITTALINANANPAMPNIYGEHPLHCGAQGAQLSPSLVQLLLTKNALINAQDKYGCTPLHIAVNIDNNIHNITALLGANADPNAMTNAGETVLQYAAYARNKRAIKKLLVDHGATDRKCAIS